MEEIVMIRIDKGIPVPRIKQLRNTPKYPFDKMEVGDSFMILCEEDKVKNQSRLISIAKNSYLVNAKLKGIQSFTTRILEDGVRCWRTA
jgi:hypothetical protein